MKYQKKHAKLCVKIYFHLCLCVSSIVYVSAWVCVHLFVSVCTFVWECVFSFLSWRLSRRSLSHTHKHSPPLSHTHKHSLSLTHTHKHTLSLTHTHKHTLSHSHTHKLSLSPSLAFSRTRAFSLSSPPPSLFLSLFLPGSPWKGILPSFSPLSLTRTDAPHSWKLTLPGRTRGEKRELTTVSFQEWGASVRVSERGLKEGRMRGL